MPAGSPLTPARISAITRPVWAAWAGSLITAAQPAARAGAYERTDRYAGEFQGVMMPATPIGWRSTIDCWPGRVSVTRPKLLTARPGREPQRPRDEVHLVAGLAPELAVLQAEGVDQVARPRLVGVGQPVQHGRAEHRVVPPLGLVERVGGGRDGLLGFGPAAVGEAADDLAGGGVDAGRARVLRGRQLAADPVPCLRQR